MIKEYFHIAHLISKHLSGEVTPEESRFLDKWRKESKSHEQLFQKICSDEHYAQHEIRKMEFDSQAGWKGVETRIKRMALGRRIPHQFSNRLYAHQAYSRHGSNRQ